MKITTGLGQARTAGLEALDVAACTALARDAIDRARASAATAEAAAKEAAMLDRQMGRLRAQLVKLDTRWRAHPTGQMEAVGRRVGRCRSRGWC